MVKKGLIAGAAALVLGLVVSKLVEFLLPGLSEQYMNEQMFRPWSDPLMMVYFLYPFILGFVLFYLWKKLSKPKAIELAKLYFVVATLPGMFVTYTSFQISLGLVLLWAVTGFAQVYIAGFIFSKVK